MTTIRVIASTLCFALTAAPAAAQTVSTPSPAPQPVLTTTPTSTTTSGTTTGSTSVSGTTTGDTSTTTGAYDRLSIGNRKIARALFEAQQSGPTGGTTGTGTTETGTAGTGTTGTGTTGTGTTATTGKMTLDQIAAMKQSGQGWGQVFKQMQARGLVTEKNLGQVVSQYHKQQNASRSEGTTAANRAVDGDTTTGAAHGGKPDRDSSGGYGSGHGNTNSGPNHVSGGRGSDYRGGGHGGGTGTGGGHGKSK